MLSKHEEHNKCPFLLQKDFVDLSISFLQIRHLNIGDISLVLIYNQKLNKNKIMPPNLLRYEKEDEPLINKKYLKTKK